MTRSDAARVPLDQVAADQRPLIEAFRAAGEVSFQDVESIADSRANYEKSCAANGLAPDAVARVEDVDLGEFRVRVYDPRPAAEGPSPVIVFAHGGGWVIGSLETHDRVCRRLAVRTGLPIVAIDYRLGPEHRFPAGHDDSRDAVAWVRDQADARGWDPQRIVTVGDSAGGGIATALAHEPSMRVDGTKVVAQVLLYPVVDISQESAGYERISAGFPLTADSMRWFAANYLDDPSSASDPRLSPLAALRAAESAGVAASAADATAASAGAGETDATEASVDEQPGAQPPAWILALGLDPLGDEAVNYAAALTRTGTHVELVYLPHHAHGIFTSAGKIGTGERMLDQAAAFILRQLAQ